MCRYHHHCISERRHKPDTQKVVLMLRCDLMTIDVIDCGDRLLSQVLSCKSTFDNIVMMIAAIERRKV